MVAAGCGCALPPPQAARAVASAIPTTAITNVRFRTSHSPCPPVVSVEFGSSGHFYKVVRDSGTRSGAALPLLKNDSAVGVILFSARTEAAFAGPRAKSGCTARTRLTKSRTAG